MTLSNKPRRIIVCLDGTWDSPEETTNVSKFYNNIDIKFDDHYEYKKKYFLGVGSNWRHRYLGGFFGYGIEEQIKKAYKYICANYRNEDDQIWLIGFSRGAYAVRSLVGMIYNVGLLSPPNLEHLDDAYEHYRNRNEEARPERPLSNKFFEDYDCLMPSIHFLGCFDTVGALGVPKLPWYLGGTMLYTMFSDLHEFHDAKLSPIVKNAYHAMSIHEQRKWFEPTLMQLSSLEGNHGQQRLEQVWFPGMHGDVGGHRKKCPSSPNNLISFHTLYWMMSKATENGLHFRHDAADCNKTSFVLNDSYCSSIIYRIEPREDRVIPEGSTVNICDVPHRCSHGRLFDAITPSQLTTSYDSNTLNAFLEANRSSENSCPISKITEAISGGIRKRM